MTCLHDNWSGHATTGHVLFDGACSIDPLSLNGLEVLSVDLPSVELAALDSDVLTVWNVHQQTPV
jgi:hypothetical protein